MTEQTLAGTGRANGSFGELLQGRLPEHDTHFAVSLPIEAGSRVEAMVTPGPPTVNVRPDHKWKAARIATDWLAECGLAASVTLTIETELPEGQGFGSSTADMLATVRALDAALDGRTDPFRATRMMARIEPTDGLAFDHPVAVDLANGKVLRLLAPLPPMIVAGSETGSEVNTLSVSRRRPRIGAADAAEFEELLDALEAACRQGDAAAIGRVATRSARIHARLTGRERVTSSRLMPDRALGNVIAHSGTLSGRLFPGHNHRLLNTHRNTSFEWVFRCSGRDGRARRPATE